MEKKPSKQIKKTLLEYERPVYQLKRDQQGKVGAIITKLMKEKQKPQIGFVPRSSLLQQLDSFIPLLQRSNQELSSQVVQPQIDAKFQEVVESSSSEDEDEIVNEEDKMEVQHSQQPQILQSCDEFQFNIMTYPYREEKQTDSKPQMPKTNKIEELE